MRSATIRDGLRLRPAGDSRYRMLGTFPRRQATCPNRWLQRSAANRKRCRICDAYGGAVSQAAVSPGIRVELSSKLDKLVALAGLVGLNGIDFVVDRDSFWVLEWNPRPTATLELYDPEFAEGLLRAHVSVCLCEPIKLEQHWGPVRGHTIVFARSKVSVPPDWQPESWCSDIPCPDVLISAGMPICSVRAAGNPRADVLARLSEYRAAALASHVEAIA